MDICSRIGYPVNDVNSLRGFCMDVTTLESTYELAGEFSVDGLAYVASKFLNIKDDAEGVSEKCVFQMKDERQEAHQSEINTSCAAFVGGKLKGKINDDSNVITSEVLTNDDNAKSIVPNCSSTPSLPNPSKPVSAMKGSREKSRVIPPKKLTVKWDPDVYDPIPAPSLHMAFNMPRKHGSKKKYKSKQKTETTGSKSSGGSNGTDKKQVRKSTGFKLCEHKQEVIHVSEMQPSAIDFHLAIPDLYCGSSFVNRYGSSFHHSSVAEAT